MSTNIKRERSKYLFGLKGEKTMFASLLTKIIVWLSKLEVKTEPSSSIQVLTHYLRTECRRTADSECVFGLLVTNIKLPIDDIIRNCNVLLPVSFFSLCWSSSSADWWSWATAHRYVSLQDLQTSWESLFSSLTVPLVSLSFSPTCPPTSFLNLVTW